MTSELTAEDRRTVWATVCSDIQAPPQDADCEMKYGKGYNRGYTVGHGQAKTTAKSIAREADNRINELEQKNKRLREAVNKHIDDIALIPAMLLKHFGSNFEHTAKEIERAVAELQQALGGDDERTYS